MTPANVCLVWDADYPWDVRLEKCARSLTEHGHHVAIVARNRARQESRATLPEGEVHRMPPWRALPRALDDRLSFPAFFNPRWARLIRRVAVGHAANIIVCRDLPLAPTAIWVARRLGLPMVLDMAEHYPAMMQALWDSGTKRPWDVVVRNPRAVAAVERWVLPRVDHVLVVVEENRDRLVALGVPAERVTVVSNTPPLSRVRDQAAVSNRGLDAPLALVYLGLLEAPRGVGVVLHGVRHCIDVGIPVTLQVIGAGREGNAFRALVRQLDLERHVEFTGRLPHQEALAAMRRADIGLVPHEPNESWNMTIPNKLFDYMAAGLPVLSSDAIPAARIVRQTGCGLVFDYRNVDSLAAAVARLRDPQTRLRYGTQGLAAARHTYHWECDADRMLGVVATLTDITPRGKKGLTIPLRWRV
jgi:glycosyltransferase involved in cell wall biosynthesis